MTSLKAPTRLVLWSRKRGQGKSTIAVMLSWHLQNKGYRVHLTDGDSDSQTAWDWVEAANTRLDAEGNPTGTPMPFSFSSAPTKNIVKQTHREMDGDVDVIVYDVEGGNDDIYKAALEDATAVIIVTTESKIDYQHVPEVHRRTVNFLADIGKSFEDIDYVLCFNRVDQRRGDADRKALTDLFANQFGFTVLDNFLPFLKQYEQVKDFNPDDVSGFNAEHIKALADELIDEDIIKKGHVNGH